MAQRLRPARRRPAPSERVARGTVPGKQSRPEVPIAPPTFAEPGRKRMEAREGATSVSLAESIWREGLWQFASKFMLILFAAKARVRVRPYHQLPRQGGFILASNHISHFDPPIITVFSPRRIDWIGMSDLFRSRPLRGLFSGLNVIPIERNGPDRAALRLATTRLKEGRVVGIFPEGGIRDGDASIVNGAPMKQGVSLLAAISEAPLVPCVILGSDRLYNPRNWLPWRRPEIWIGYGQPILPRGESQRKKDYVREQFRREIVKLKEQLCADFRLSEADLPQSPQQRMREP